MKSVSVALFWRNKADREWRQQRMRPLGNDRWVAAFPLEAIGMYEFAVEGWRDAFATWRDEVAKKHAAGVNTSLELQEGLHLVEQTAEQTAEPLAGELHALADRLRELPDDGRRAVLLSPEAVTLMSEADPRPFAVRTAPLSVQAERTGARFASWYQIFPRSRATIQRGTAPSTT